MHSAPAKQTGKTCDLWGKQHLDPLCPRKKKKALRNQNQRSMRGSRLETIGKISTTLSTTRCIGCFVPKMVAGITKDNEKTTLMRNYLDHTVRHTVGNNANMTHANGT